MPCARTLCPNSEPLEFKIVPAYNFVVGVRALVLREVRACECGSARGCLKAGRGLANKYVALLTVVGVYSLRVC